MSAIYWARSVLGMVMLTVTAPLAAQTEGDNALAITYPAADRPLADPALRSPAPPLFVAVEVPPDRTARNIELLGSNAGDTSADRYAPDKPFRLTFPAIDWKRFAAMRGGVVEDPSSDQGSGFDQALECMTMAIAYEAGHEPVAGMESVGQVILNRVRSARFPKSACAVVFQGAARRTGCQFTFTCDGSLRRSLLGGTIERSRAAALAVLSGVAADHVAGATHYHADYVLPRWAGDGTRVAKIGAHIFYRMPGDGRASAAAGYLATGAEVALASTGRRMVLAGPRALRAVFSPWGLSMGAR